MKKIYLAFLILTAFTHQTRGQNLFTEDFMYQAVDSLENSGKWFRGGIDQPYNIKVTEPGLVYPGFPGSGRGNSALIANSGSGDVVISNLDNPVETGNVYTAFLLRIDSIPSNNQEGFFVALNHSLSTDLNTRLVLKTESKSGFKLGIQKEYEKQIVYASKEFRTKTTYLVVLKYSFIAGSNNDMASLYVIEGNVPQTEPSSASAKSSDGIDYLNQASVVLSNNYARDGVVGVKIFIDGIRVGTTWESSVLAPVISGTYSNTANGLQMDNFPNPFTEQTKIRVQLPFPGLVKMNIYNAAGMNVAELMHEHRPEGDFETYWDACSFPAGLYHCVIRVNGYSTYNRMLLLK